MLAFVCFSLQDMPSILRYAHIWKAFIRSVSCCWRLFGMLHLVEYFRNNFFTTFTSCFKQLWWNIVDALGLVLHVLYRCNFWHLVRLHMFFTVLFPSPIYVRWFGEDISIFVLDYWQTRWPFCSNFFDDFVHCARVVLLSISLCLFAFEIEVSVFVLACASPYLFWDR